MASEIRSRAGRRPGFTLIELIITLAILVIVLGMAYRILENCLRTEKWIERQTIPEKVGEAIISLIRRDIEGVVYKNLGTDRVFQLIDNGDGEVARDELQLYTTVEPTPMEDAAGLRGTLDDPNRRTITPVHYFLKENNLGLYTLYRREITLSDGDPFTSGSGTNFEIYDKVKSLSFIAFDDSQSDLAGQAGYSPWVTSWDSQQRLIEADDVEAANAAGSTPGAATGIPRAADTAKANATAGTASSSTATDADDQTVLPPSPIPSAMRIEVAIYAGDEKGLYKDNFGNPLPAKLFAVVVPILVSQRIVLTSPDDTSQGTDTTGATGGSASGSSASSGSASGGSSSSKGKSGSSRTSSGSR